ncbi:MULTISPECIES: CaiB/BaiF CoA-transferase family protein [unclassified Iodidimonas]|jgi:crotonobetainyl-CoA:carnitine CoA-transferase CaiB-like acyl-CoA transferase|uniref:CaiB/BaiF CoA transferase family protein n=1 Tax=unclassified Iodidimonas TaxID=2626145 RepID=UPI002482DBF1|nr:MULTISPECIES: CaiB/BaiF CoA-transferase family protein [unclassified Iodidimonas]
MTKILKDIRVVEMGTFITGPAAAMYMADQGADVIKVERPETGDPFRAFKGGLYSPHFQTYNRNKRSIALDTRQPEDQAVLHELIKTADVFIQNFRPGVAEKLGAGEETLRAINPRLIYCSISGFGTSGPAMDRPAFDTVAQAASGYLRLLVPHDKPRVLGPAIADAVTGFYASYGILAALVERGTSGKGRRVDVSMLEAMCHFNLDSFTHYFSMNEVMDPYSRPSVSQSYVFECADGKWVALHLSSPPKFWDGLAAAIEKPDLFDDPRFADRAARIKHQDDLIDLMAPIFRRHDRAYWCDRLEAEGVPYSAAYDSDEALEDPQARHLKIKVSTHHPVMGEFTTVRSPLSYDGAASLDVLAPPMLDEHGAEIRAELAGQNGSVRNQGAAE